MELKKIKTQKDIELVKEFFYEIFLEEANYDLIHFKNSVTGKHNFHRLEYYIGFEKNVPVGVTGIYAQNPDECWLGWFGIRPEYRGKGYATAMLDLQLKLMQDYGYKICRIYTNKIINKEAVCLYIKKGFRQDSTYCKNIITLSKSLDGITAPAKWKGVPLEFVPEWPV